MSAKVKNCPICGNLFIALPGVRVCRDCRDIELQKEKEIISYVREHPKSTVQEILDATGCSEKMLRRMIKEGRFIEFRKDISYPCKKCGRPIIAGKYCKDCYEKMQQKLRHAQLTQMDYLKKKEKEGDKEKKTYSEAMLEKIMK